MPPTTAQRNLINQFMSITGAPERAASRLLKQSSWKLDQACDSYFASGISTPKDVNVLEKLFEKYRDPKTDPENTISVEGTMSYLGDLGVNLENVEVLVPLEIVQAVGVGEITREGFINGWRAIGSSDTIVKQKAYVANQINQLSTDIALFKRVYKHTFICSRESGAKALALENALIYWEMLFTPPGRAWVTVSTNWFELWSEFLKAKWTKSINKDMWNQTLEFSIRTMQDETLSFWSEDGAWPGVIDEFVAYVKEKRGTLPENMETD